MEKQPGFFDVEERLAQAGAIERLFERFDATLRNAGYLPISGQILPGHDLVAAPKQRNTNDEKTDLREGRTPQDWQDKPSHKDRHAQQASCMGQEWITETCICSDARIGHYPLSPRQ